MYITTQTYFAFEGAWDKVMYRQEIVADSGSRLSLHNKKIK